MSSAAQERALLVPEGLAGERVDSGLARLFGISRSKAADLLGQGRVRLDGAAAAKSERLVPGTLLEVSLPVVTDSLEVRAEVVEGIRAHQSSRVWPPVLIQRWTLGARPASMASRSTGAATPSSWTTSIPAGSGSPAAGARTPSRRACRRARRTRSDTT